MPVEFVGILALQACVDIFVALIGVFITYYIVKAYSISGESHLVFIFSGFGIYSSTLMVRSLIILLGALTLNPIIIVISAGMSKMLPILIPLSYSLIAVGYTLSIRRLKSLKQVTILNMPIIFYEKYYNHRRLREMFNVTLALPPLSDLLSIIPLTYIVLILMSSKIAGQKVHSETLLSFTLLIASHVASIIAILMLSLAFYIASHVLRAMGFLLIMLVYYKLSEALGR